MNWLHPAHDEFPHDVLTGFGPNDEIVLRCCDFDFGPVMMLEDWTPIAELIARQLGIDWLPLLATMKEALQAGMVISQADHDGEIDWPRFGYLHGMGFREPDYPTPTAQGLLAHIAEQRASRATRDAKKRLIAERRYEFQKSRAQAALALIDAGHSYVCAECNSADDLTIDHITPLSRGGGDELANLRFLCRSCNSAKGARLTVVSG